MIGKNVDKLSCLHIDIGTVSVLAVKNHPLLDAGYILYLYGAE